MWSTIANFKENLTQIASDVLDTADELKRGRSEDRYDDEYEDEDPATSHPSEKETDFRVELAWYRNEVPRLQAAESEIQSKCSRYESTLQDKEDELLRFREENKILKEKFTAAASENSSQFRSLRSEVQCLQEAIKELESEQERKEELHQKEITSSQDDHQERFEQLVAQHLQELSRIEVQCGSNHHVSGKVHPSISNGPVHHDTDIRKLESQLLELRKHEKDLSSQLLEKDQIYGKLRTAHDRSLFEVRRLKEELSRNKDASVQKDLLLERSHEAAKASSREYEVLRVENLKMSGKLDELEQSLNEKDSSSGRIVKEFQQTVSSLVTKNAELEEERDGVLKTLEEHYQSKEYQSSMESARAAALERESLALKEAAREVDRLLERVKEAEKALASQKLEFEKQLEQLMSERDKAIRDVGRLRQHLLDKERADSEKMDQDSEQIAELQVRAESSTSRAIKSEQALSVALADLKEARKHSKESLSKATEEIGSLEHKLVTCMAAIESKDVELSNLQSALGQYYAESEAQDRIYLELSASKEECGRLSQDFEKANETIEAKIGERDAALEKLALLETTVSEKQQKIQKLEDEILRLRRALEQSMSRLNSLSSDSDHHVDKRIVIKLLVTYFQKNHSKEVLDLMVRMLGFSEEDKKRVGVAQQVASRGVVRGVLGLPGRFVGGIIGSGSAPADSLSLPSTPSENKSFADLWIDFLLKESEERERREKAEAIERAEKDMGNDQHRSGTSNEDSQPYLEHSGSALNGAARGSFSMPPSPNRVIAHRPSNSFSNFSSALESSNDPSSSSDNLETSSQMPVPANGKILRSRSSDVIAGNPGNDMSNIPFNSSALSKPIQNLSHLKLPPRF